MNEESKSMIGLILNLLPFFDKRDEHDTKHEADSDTTTFKTLKSEEKSKTTSTKHAQRRLCDVPIVNYFLTG